MAVKKKRLFRINEIQYIKTYYTVAETPIGALNHAKRKKIFFLIRHSPHLIRKEPERVVEEVTDVREFNLVNDRFPKVCKEARVRL